MPSASFKGTFIGCWPLPVREFGQGRMALKFLMTEAAVAWGSLLLRITIAVLFPRALLLTVLLFRLPAPELSLGDWFGLLNRGLHKANFLLLCPCPLPNSHLLSKTEQKN